MKWREKERLTVSLALILSVTARNVTSRKFNSSIFSVAQFSLLTSNYLSIKQMLSVHIYLFIYLSVCVSVSLNVFMGPYLFQFFCYLSIYISVSKSINLFFFPSFYLSVYLSHYLSIYLSIYLCEFMVISLNSCRYTNILFSSIYSVVGKELLRHLKNIYLYTCRGGARGVMVIVAGNIHGDTSSNPGRDWLDFT